MGRNAPEHRSIPPTCHPQPKHCSAYSQYHAQYGIENSRGNVTVANQCDRFYAKGRKSCEATAESGGEKYKGGGGERASCNPAIYQADDTRAHDIDKECCKRKQPGSSRCKERRTKCPGHTAGRAAERNPQQCFHCAVTLLSS